MFKDWYARVFGISMKFAIAKAIERLGTVGKGWMAFLVCRSWYGCYVDG